jgi:photosystem II stability/assembly factor-like uncharacterized protein
MRTMRALLVPLGLLTVAHTAQAAPIPASAYQDLHWRNLGPFRGGRTRAVAGVATQPNVFYMAPVNGGIWKTDDAGRTWRPIFDDQPTQSIGSLAVAASNPNIIYAGSGEGLHRPDLSVGDGIYRSDDAGKTWRHLGLDDAQQIPQLAVDPKNPERVFAAVLGHPYGPSAQRGVFRSLDGGKTWRNVLFKDADTGASDVAIDPLHPDTVYAAMWQSRLGPSEDGNEYEGAGGGLYKSTDAGTSWTKLAGGLPANAVQFALAISPSQPSQIYVALATNEGGEYSSAKGNGLYRSDDAGATWTRITSDERAALKIGGGDLMVPVVDPKHPDVVYVASIVAMRSRDGGKTWTWLRGAPGGDDYQNLWINPIVPDTLLLVSDQGASITVNGGATWSSWYNQPTAQLYHVGVTADPIYKVCSGQQESGSVCIASRGNDGSIGYRDWHPVAASEYGYVTPDPRDPNIIYGAGRNQVSRYHVSTGMVEDVTPIPARRTYRVDRTQPLIFSPLRPDTLYYAANVLFETKTGGRTWTAISPDLAHPAPGVPETIGALGRDRPIPRGTIYAVAPSHKTIDTIWVGTDDGKVWTTRDHGKHWADITPPSVTAWSKVTQIDASPFDDTSAYVSINRSRIDDRAPYIFKTHDAGKTWTAITIGLPSSPVNTVRADPVRPGLLYASTETGVWLSYDDGGQWQSLQQNLPHTSARDLVVHGDDLIVATHGRGFWVMDNIRVLRQWSAAQPDTLFEPPVAYRIPRSTYPDTPVPPDEPMAENPPTGAILDYYLAEPATSVRLEIRDARGVVRSYASADPPELSAEQIAHQLIPAYWLAPQHALPATAGMHRWIWDLRGPPPSASDHEYPISAAPHDTPRAPDGPRVMPGTYTVTLTANGKTLTTKLEVRLDPRTKLNASTVAQQNRLEVRLADLLAKSGQLVMQTRSVEEQLGRLGARAAAQAAEVAKIGAGPKDAPAGTYIPNASAVNHTIASLYAAIAIDAAPTMAQLDAATTADNELAALSRQWEDWKAANLPKLNRDLATEGLGPIRPEQHPSARPLSGDEE